MMNQLADLDFDEDALQDIGWAASAFLDPMRDVVRNWPVDAADWDEVRLRPLEEIKKLRRSIAEIEGGISEARRQLKAIERRAWRRARVRIAGDVIEGERRIQRPR
jgi:hypothetical protein